jgi:hypothetical protein
MTTLRAVVRDRRIDVPAPSDMPDGTEVLLTIGTDFPEDDGPMPPEEIARVLAAMEKIEPFDWAPEERAAADAWEKKANDYTIANMDRGMEDVFP